MTARAAPSIFPYPGHRTMAEVMASDIAAAAEIEAKARVHRVTVAGRSQGNRYIPVPGRPEVSGTGEPCFRCGARDCGHKERAA